MTVLRHSQQRHRSISLLHLFVTLLLFQILLLHNNTCSAKEIVATAEWTLLQENDTVDAGLHIRMDMTTGEKWVKLMDNDHENDDNGNDNVETQHVELPASSLSSSSSSSQAVGNAVQVMPDGSLVQQETETLADKSKQKPSEPNYDFDMMHRTLSQLPDEEKERIGLPELPKHSKKKKVSDQQRAAFQAQLTLIWERRQEELRLFQEDNLADLPGILKVRIQSLQAYLDDPLAHLKAMDLEHNNNNNNNANGDDDEEDANNVVTHIVSVLIDLEYHLSDIDMARDFHTLGGWPLLLSLVSEQVHHVSNQNSHNSTTTTTTTTTQEEESDDLMYRKINAVQAHAAWAAGTAVKNTAEFAPFATETISIGLVKTTAVDLMLAQFVATLQQQQELSLSSSSSSLSSLPLSLPSIAMKLQKTLYGLGALLRGNRPAQVHFCALGHDGPKLLSQALLASKSLVEDGSSLPHATKIIKRLLSLADDIVSDVKLHPAKTTATAENDDNAIVAAFSSDEWCQLTVTALQRSDPVLYETALRTVGALQGHCTSSALWDTEAVQQSVEAIRDEWKALGSSSTDADILKERLELIDTTIAALTGESKN